MLGPGTLYGAINALVERGWITSSSERDSRKKKYIITAAGRKVFDGEIDRLKELLHNSESIRGGERP